MIDHPTDDALLAFADDEPAEVDIVGISGHLQACARCREVVAALREVRTALRAGGTVSPSLPRTAGWPALAARIRERHRKRVDRLASLTLVAAAAVIVVSLSIRARSSRPSVEVDSVATRSALPQRPASDEVTSTLEHLLREQRVRLSATERRTIDAIVSPLESAIRQTQAELLKDSRNSFLLSHLAQLRAKHVRALEDIVDLTRDRG